LRRVKPALPHAPRGRTRERARARGTQRSLIRK
jgi:hypothetical protein